jgi:hypothetical protein
MLYQARKLALFEDVGANEDRTDSTPGGSTGTAASDTAGSKWGQGAYQAPLGGAAPDQPCQNATYSPAAAFSSAAFSVRSQVKSGSSRPKWP